MISTMFSPSPANIQVAPIDEAGVNACRKTDCGIKSATVYLGRSLPSLLDEGCEFKSPLPNILLRPFTSTSAPATINHYSGGKWQSLTLAALRRAAEEIALALRQDSLLIDGYKEVHSKESRYPRAALWMNSDTAFVMADIGCLLARLITVPLSPEQSLETNVGILKETAASVLFVSKLRSVKQLLPELPQLQNLQLIVVANALDDRSKAQLEEIRWDLPETVEIVTLEALRLRAKWAQQKAQALRMDINSQDIATIVYTLTGSGRPLGAMLTHENLSGSALAAFSTLPCLRKGSSEVALSFLPLHHIFARAFVYGSLCYGHSLYFSRPRLVMKHLKELKPTVFYAVPRLLEKVYEGWQEAALNPENQLSGRSKKQLKSLFRKPQQAALSWAWNLVERHPLDETVSFLYRLQLWAARKSILRPLKNLFGGKLECFIVGGAALPANVMSGLSAAGLKLCQGYGLTEASSTLSFTRRHWQRAGTVGVPMPGVELALAFDGEVMVKAPYVMQGYYRHPKETRKVLEPNGWLHTGDIGQFSADGLLTLTGYKKELFKLSIGEYVAPAPIEQALCKSPLVERALVVGPGRKFCGALIFFNQSALETQARQMGLATPSGLLPKQPQVVAVYQLLIDQINTTLPFWSTVKRFELVAAEPSVEDAWAIANRPLERESLYRTFAEDIDRLYQPLRRKGTPQKTAKRSRKWPTLWSAARLRPKKTDIACERASVAESH